MTDMEAIRARHSVRKYSDKPIEPEKVRALVQRIDELNNEYGLHMQFVPSAGEVFSGLTSKFTGWSGIPAYIAMIGRRSEQLDELCGYVGEQLVLYAQKLGLNTCWAGFFRRRQVTAEIADGERLVLVIAVGCGVNNGHSRRSKSAENVTDVKDMPDWFRAGVEAALLAPTAVNQQKFIFTLDGEKPSARISANGPFVRLDLGIVKYHFEVGSGKKIFDLIRNDEEL